MGTGGATQTDVITTTARDDSGQTVTSQSQATVRITDVAPTITVTKSPSPISRPQPGGTFRFTVVVTNTSVEPVTITSLVDDVYGNLDRRGSCAVGTRLAARGGSYSCAFDGDFIGAAGASQTDTVTVIAVDDDNTTVTAVAKATVSITPVGTPPVTTPPPTVPPAQPRPQTPTPIVPVGISPTPQVLVRTGSDLSGPARLAGLLLIVGMTLLAATRNWGLGGPRLAPEPAGPGGGGGWFMPPRPPQGPLGGLGVGLTGSPPPVRRAEPV
jgi:hypothetical protein